MEPLNLRNTGQESTSTSSLWEIATPDSSRDPTGCRWPAFTDLIRGPKGVLLTNQSHEVKIMIRKAFILIEEKLLFENPFPLITDRSAWDRSALSDACTYNAQISTKGAKQNYIALRVRVNIDTIYSNQISSLLNLRVSSFRKDAKLIAVNNVMGYGLRAEDKGCGRLVKQLMQQSTYIFLTTANGNVDGSKPYQHPVMISTLHDLLFCPGDSVLTKYPDRFNEEDAQTLTLEPATVAFAATLVYAALDEWREGWRKPCKFYANLFTDVYNQHVKRFEGIKKQDENKYHGLLRRLFRLACRDPTSAEGSSDSGSLDIEHMEAD